MNKAGKWAEWEGKKEEGKKRQEIGRNKGRWWEMAFQAEPIAYAKILNSGNYILCLRK